MLGPTNLQGESPQKRQQNEIEALKAEYKASLSKFEEELQQTKQELATHKEFLLPFALTQEELIIVDKSIADELVSFVKEQICNGFA